MKKILFVCIVAVSILGVSCSSTAKSKTDNTLAMASTISNLLNITPENCGISSVDNLKDNTSSLLKDISSLLINTSGLYNKVHNKDTRKTVSVGDVLKEIASLNNAKANLNNLNAILKNVTQEVKTLTPSKKEIANKTLGYIENALNSSQTILNNENTTLNDLFEIVKKN